MNERDERRFSIPVAAGGAAGAGAWVLGYLVTALVASDRLRDDVVVEIFRTLAGNPSDWRLAGLLFYNGHYVDTRFPPMAFAPSAYNYVSADENLGILFLVAPLALAGAGAVVAARSRGELRSVGDGAIAGATVIVAYLPLAAVGVVVFSIEAGNGTIRPDPIAAILLAGIVYPVVFGGIGGVLAGAILDRAV